MKKKIMALFCATTLFHSTPIFAKTFKYKTVEIPKVTTYPKREMRAVWIATVQNIDWPSKKNLSAEKQKEEYINLLDEIVGMGMNAVIVQVRPTADRFYKSNLGNKEPWSSYLTGELGKDPGYDPLKFMVDEAHKRNLEFHAWFNPYRITMDPKEKLPNDHPAVKNPDWIIKYGGKMYYDPGNPKAREFTEQIVLDVVKNYDIDAVHMDDYFYPYPVQDKNKKNIPFPDDKSYKASKTKLSKEDWRRDSVNKFIESLSKNIKKIKPYVKFGISPFGVWRNDSADPSGSATKAGPTNYDVLYADTREWIKKGWIDYITPQIYWDFGYKPAAYETLVDWWKKEVKMQPKIHLYVGQAAYRLGGKRWENEAELPNQIKYNRDKKVEGSMYFGLQNMINNKQNIKVNLQKDLYLKKALIPAMPWLATKMPSPVQDFKVNKSGKDVTLTWKDTNSNSTSYYVVYKNNEIIDTIPKLGKNSFTFKLKSTNPKDVFKVTAVDRVHNESK
jgi:uncharacterized lipoprotein YddW (UPF0748 family)